MDSNSTPKSNVSNSKADDIDYFYATRLAGEPAGGIEDASAASSSRASSGSESRRPSEAAVVREPLCQAISRPASGA